MVKTNNPDSDDELKKYIGIAESDKNSVNDEEEHISRVKVRPIKW